MDNILGILKFNDFQSWLNVLWMSLEKNRDNFNDKEWDEICTSMAWIKEELNYKGE